MRNKKGFTLMEILTVIAIIGIIMLIAVPSIIGIGKSIKRRQLETKKKVIISAAEVYGKNNVSEFGGGDILRIPVRTLLYYGYITKEAECSESIGCIINPVDDSSMNDWIITIKRNLTITQAEWGDEYGNAMCATFDWNDGSGRIESRCCSESYKKCEIKTPVITRNGFEILGWNTTSTATEGKIEENTKITITGSITYYGITKKNVTVTFNPNGGQITSGEDIQKCNYYNKDTFCSVTGPTAGKVGYAFKGWNTLADGSGTVINLSNISDSIIAYAKWNAHVLSLSYNGNGQTNFSSNNTSHNLTVDSNGNVLDNGTLFTQSADYNEVFNAGGGLANYDNEELINFVKQGYHGLKQNEWYIENSSGTKTYFNQNDETVTTNALAEAAGCNLSANDCSVVAKVNWDINKLYIQYNGNGGTWVETTSNKDVYNVNQYGTVILSDTNTVYTQVVEYGQSLPNAGLVDYNGAWFNWTNTGYGVPSASQAYYIKTDPSKTALSQATVYSASYLASLTDDCNIFDVNNCLVQLKVNWAMNEFTVAYNANGGTGTMSSHTCSYDEDCILSNNGFSKSGFTFVGWKKENSGNTLPQGSNVKNAVNSGTVTYYAQWEARSNNICDFVFAGRTHSSSTIKAECIGADKCGIKERYGDAVLDDFPTSLQNGNISRTINIGDPYRYVCYSKTGNNYYRREIRVEKTEKKYKCSKTVYSGRCSCVKEKSFAYYKPVMCANNCDGTCEKSVCYYDVRDTYNVSDISYSSCSSYCTSRGYNSGSGTLNSSTISYVTNWTSWVEGDSGSACNSGYSYSLNNWRCPTSGYISNGLGYYCHSYVGSPVTYSSN